MGNLGHAPSSHASGRPRSDRCSPSISFADRVAGRIGGEQFDIEALALVNAERDRGVVRRVKIARKFSISRIGMTGDL